MSLLYPTTSTVSVEINRDSDTSEIEFVFSADCGKFGTDEELAGFTIKPEQLFALLAKHFEESEE